MASKCIPILECNTDSINKMRNRIKWQLPKETLFESIYELKIYLYKILQTEENKWHSSVKNWNKIINRMDCNLSEKILEMLMEKTEAGKTTYQDINKMMNKLRQKMMQKLLDKEFEEHMKYKKGSHE